MKPCELRIERDAPDGGRQIVCGAGGFVLGTVGGDEGVLEATCGRCTIPETVADDAWACLHLRPVKIPDGDAHADRFSCRWFYRAMAERQPTSLAGCHECPHWFPRPPVDVMVPLGYFEETERIRAFARHPEIEPIPVMKPRPRPEGWIARLRQSASRRGASPAKDRRGGV